MESSTTILWIGLVFPSLTVIFLAYRTWLRDRQIRIQLGQIRCQHEWNRRKAALDLVMDATTGPLRLWRNNLEKKIQIYDRDQTYTSVRDDLTKDDLQVLDSILNHLENVCLAVKHRIVDDEIVRQALDGVVRSYVRWAGPYITSNRALDPRLWIEFDAIVQDWAEKDKDLQRRLVEPGKPSLPE